MNQTHSGESVPREMRRVGWMTAGGALHTDWKHDHYHASTGIACRPVYVKEPPEFKAWEDR